MAICPTSPANPPKMNRALQKHRVKMSQKFDFIFLLKY